MIFILQRRRKQKMSLAAYGSLPKTTSRIIVDYVLEDIYERNNADLEAMKDTYIVINFDSSEEVELLSHFSTKNHCSISANRVAK